MASEQNLLERHLADMSSHASRVRIVPDQDLEEAIDEMAMLFPHEVVLNAHMGCHHVCVYTSSAPASVIDQRIREHRREIEHLPSF